MKFHVPDMSCGHCVAAIEKAVKAADPLAIISTDTTSQTANIDATLPTAALIQVLAEAGYQATALEKGAKD